MVKEQNGVIHILHTLRKADIFLIAGCLFAALFSGIFFMVYRGPGDSVRISCNGRDVYETKLHSAKDSGFRYYMILYEGDKVNILPLEDYPSLPEGQSYNLISVGNGVVTMEAADCRDQICVRHRPISGDRENIICLPHKLIVEINGSEGISGSGVHPALPGKNPVMDGNTDERPEETLDGVVG